MASLMNKLMNKQKQKPSSDATKTQDMLSNPVLKRLAQRANLISPTVPVLLALSHSLFRILKPVPQTRNLSLFLLSPACLIFLPRILPLKRLTHFLDAVRKMTQVVKSKIPSDNNNVFKEWKRRSSNG